MSPAMVTLAQAGPAAFRDRYACISRQRAACPKALWQAEHTRLDLRGLDATMGDYFLGRSNHRPHRDTGLAPLKAWRGHGWLPRLPASLAELALLLGMVATTRMVRRDGVHVQGLRSREPPLAASGGEPVPVRYEPRAIAAMRVLHHNRFLCRAIHPEHAGRTLTLKDLQTARARDRRARRTAMNERLARGADLLPDQAPSNPPPKKAAATQRRSAPKLSPSLEDQPRRPVLGASVPVPCIAPKAHRHGTECAHARRKQRTIGGCVGPAGVGNTLAARRHAPWELAEPLLQTWGPREPAEDPVEAAWARSRPVFHPPTGGGTLRELRQDLQRMTSRVAIWIAQQRSIHRTGDRGVARDRRIALIMMDDAERLSPSALEHLRAMFARTPSGLMLMGMPGMAQRMARYPQLYSRVGFAPHSRPLQGDELTFVLTRPWRPLGLSLDSAEVTDTQAIAAISRLTRGNFRLLHRLLGPIARRLLINELHVITEDGVEAARSTLVIGATERRRWRAMDRFTPHQYGGTSQPRTLSLITWHTLCRVNLHAFLTMRQRAPPIHGVDPRVDPRQDPRCSQAPAVPEQPPCPGASHHPWRHRHPRPPRRRRRAEVLKTLSKAVPVPSLFLSSMEPRCCVSRDNTGEEGTEKRDYRNTCQRVSV